MTLVITNLPPFRWHSRVYPPRSSWSRHPVEWCRADRLIWRPSARAWHVMSLINAFQQFAIGAAPLVGGYLISKRRRSANRLRQRRIGRRHIHRGVARSVQVPQTRARAMTAPHVLGSSMPNQIALLRGINVGGRNKVAMSDLHPVWRPWPFQRDNAAPKRQCRFPERSTFRIAPGTLLGGRNRQTSEDLDRLSRPQCAAVEEDRRPQSLPPTSERCPQSSRCGILENGAADHGRRRAACRHQGPRNHSRRWKPTLCRLSIGNWPLEVDGNVDRSKSRFPRHGTELEYSSKTPGIVRVSGLFARVLSWPFMVNSRARISTRITSMIGCHLRPNILKYFTDPAAKLYIQVKGRE